MIGRRINCLKNDADCEFAKREYFELCRCGATKKQLPNKQIDILTLHHILTAFLISQVPLNQGFPNCGTRTSSGTRRDLLCFSSQKIILTAIIFLLINSWIFVLPTSLVGFQKWP